MNPIQLPQVPQMNPPWIKQKPNLSVSLFGKPKTNQNNGGFRPTPSGSVVPYANTPAPAAAQPTSTTPAPAPQNSTNIKYSPYVSMGSTPTQTTTTPTPQQTIGVDGQPHYNVPAPQPIVPINEQMPTLGNRDISKMSARELQDFKTSLDTAYNRRQTELEGQGRGITLNQIQGQQGVIERIRQGETAGLEQAIAGKKEEEAMRSAERLAAIRAGGGSGVNSGSPTSFNSKDPRGFIAELFSKNSKLKRNAQIDTAGAVISNIQEIANKNSDGRIKGTGIFGGGFLPRMLLGSKGVETRAGLSGLRGTVEQWLSGAALSKRQEKYVLNMVPDRNDTDKVARAKINSLTNYMLSDIAGRVSTQGVNVEVPSVDFFNENTSKNGYSAKISQAIAQGYEPKEIISVISESDPDMAEKVKIAVENGYTEDDIIDFLSKQ